jgi:hypothetical protein
MGFQIDSAWLVLHKVDGANDPQSVLSWSNLNVEWGDGQCARLSPSTLPTVLPAALAGR